jgi:hypothetical protein
MKNSVAEMIKQNVSIYTGLKGKILRKWDWWVYCRAINTMRRMAIENPGWSYLMELQIKGWNAEHPISPSLKSSTEHFHRSMTEH